MVANLRDFIFFCLCFLVCPSKISLFVMAAHLCVVEQML